MDWTRLKNPVLQYETWSGKDYAATRRDGVWYLFFSAFYEDNGRVRSHVVGVSTPDFLRYSRPLLHLDGQGDGWIGLCSPDLTIRDGRYCLTFNSWGDKEGRPNQLFYCTSPDLRAWSEPRPLAANLTAGTRAIDAAVAFDGSRGMYLVWKEVQTTRLAAAPSLDSNFVLVEEGYPALTLRDGTACNGENYQFHELDGRRCLLATWMGGRHLPCLFTRQETGAGEEDWLAWGEGRVLDVPLEPFNTADRANAAALVDERSQDGYFYLFYAGNIEKASFLGRGHNRLGLARSRDLTHWEPAGL